MRGTEAIRTAMKKYGNKPMTGEQVRWGFENLNLTAERIKELGFEGMVTPIKLRCQDHQGADIARVQQWDGKEWKIISGNYKADLSILDPMVKDQSAKYAADKKSTPRDCSKESCSGASNRSGRRLAAALFLDERHDGPRRTRRQNRN